MGPCSEFQFKRLNMFRVIITSLTESLFVSQIIPLAWCLMARKTEAAYIAVLSIIRARLRTWNFERVVCDFEDAIMNAARAVFRVEVQGCFFHSVNVSLQEFFGVNGALLKLYLSLFCMFFDA